MNDACHSSTLTAKDGIRRGALAAFAAAAGTAAYSFPLTTHWQLLSIALAFLAGVVLSSTFAGRTIWSGLCLATLISVLLGFVSSTLAVSVVAAASLLVWGATSTAVSVLLMNLAVVVSIQERIANLLHKAELEAAGPALIAIAILLLAQPRLVTYAAAAVAFSALGAFVSTQMLLLPGSTMVIAALPAICFAALVTRSEKLHGAKRPRLFLSIVILLTALSWAWAPPRSGVSTSFILPEAPNAYEAKFYSNYAEALAFAGIRASRADSLESIPPGSLLLLPWLTAPFNAEQGDAIAKRIGELARARDWIVIAAGEHTNLGDVATRIEVLSGRRILRDDLTVPPNNTDTSGPLHASDLRQWPHDANLNRGASVSPSLMDKILLAGDGWWAEPDIGEWLWVGDYSWQPSDRSGRLTLAASTDIGGARWVVIGDNTPFINNQLIADPRPAIRILNLATLWPALVKDFYVLVLCFCLVGFTFKSSDWMPSIAVSSLLCVAVLSLFHTSRGSAAWRDFYVGESAFDERNFNLVLSDNPTLLKGRRLIRIATPISGSIALPEGNSVIFVLVDGKAEVGGVKLNQCRRMGSLQSAEGPHLMDAQACHVNGAAKILIGSAESSAAFAVTHDKGVATVILDTAFLSQRAPLQNATWLLSHLP